MQLGRLHIATLTTFSVTGSIAEKSFKNISIEYQLLILELDRLWYSTLYSIIEIGCLGHFLTPSIRTLQATIEQSVLTCKFIVSKATQKATV